MKIVIVDDDWDLMYLLKEVVTQLGHSVITARNGKECVDWIKGHACDLLLFDFNMPEMNGIDVMHYVRDHSLKLHAVMMTSYPIMRENFAMSLGIDDYLEKPFKLSHLERMIGEFGQSKR